MEITGDIDIETTRGEKALAAVLAVFVFLGLAWAYVHFDRDPAPPRPTAQEQAALDAHTAASARLGAAQADQAQARDRLELARERYRTALDGGSPAAVLERDYRAGERTYAVAARRVEAAMREESATAGPAAAASGRLADDSAERLRSAARSSFLLRLLLVLAAVALAQLAVVHLRDSRLHPLAIGSLVAAAVLALVMGVDYVTDYVDWTAGGPLLLSLAGIAVTLVAFLALQRFLARRIPLRRVRKGCCAACGYPVRGASRCEGCGRSVVASCATCEAPRRVGTPHCGTCGAA
jgi:hypothetical protein